MPLNVIFRDCARAREARGDGSPDTRYRAAPDLGASSRAALFQFSLRSRKRVVLGTSLCTCSEFSRSAGSGGPSATEIPAAEKPAKVATEPKYEQEILRPLRARLHAGDVAMPGDNALQVVHDGVVCPPVE